LVPKKLVSIFNPRELELMISGLPKIDVKDLKLNSRYERYKSTDQYIKWFWEVVEKFNDEEKASLL